MQAHPEDEPLELRVLRGTTVLEDHERALVELCSDPTLDGSESDECVLDFLKGGYDVGVDVVSQVNGSNGSILDSDTDKEVEQNENDLLDNMYNMWADELPVSAPIEAVEETNQATNPEVKPWSSRSSPSGTWVRDPKTGEMRNIDR